MRRSLWLMMVAALAGCGEPTSTGLPIQSSPSAAVPQLTLTTLYEAPASRNNRGRDLYVVHGYLSSVWRVQTLAEQFAAARVYYRRVFAVEYHDEQAISISGRQLADLVKQTSTTVGGADIIAHSLGGLVTRWAIEELKLDDYIRNVVMLGTPHEGATAALIATGLMTPQEWQSDQWWNRLVYHQNNPGGYYSALTDLIPGSSCIRQLNLPSHTKCDYITIAGSVRPLPPLPLTLPTDLVVGVSNANWSGLSQEAYRFRTHVVPANHFNLITDKKTIYLIMTILWKEKAPPTSL